VNTQQPNVGDDLSMPEATTQYGCTKKDRKQHAKDGMPPEPAQQAWKHLNVDTTLHAKLH